MKNKLRLILIGQACIALFVTCVISCDDKDIQVQSVSIDIHESSLIVNGTVPLIATLVPTNATNNKVEWESSDNSVAKVEATGPFTAVVTAAGPGIATITLRASSDRTLTDNCRVTVTAEATLINLNQKEKLDLAIDGTFDFIATVLPEYVIVKTVTLANSKNETADDKGAGKIYTVDGNTEIATYVTSIDSKDVVTISVVGKAAGTGTLTLQSGKAKNSLTVTVLPKNPIVAFFITITPLGETGLEINGTLQFNKTISPPDATTPTIVWNSSSPNVASIDATSGLVTAKSQGQTSIKAVAGDVESNLVSVTVNPAKPVDVLVTDIILSVNALTLNPGVEGGTMPTGVVTATVVPSNATIKFVNWINSRGINFTGAGNIFTADQSTEIATLSASADAQGVVTATITGVAPGVGVLKAKSGTVEKSLTITVVSVNLSSKEETINVGKSVSVTATVQPESLTDKTVTLINSKNETADGSGAGKIYTANGNTEIATYTTSVDAKGVVTIAVNGTASGEGTLMVKTGTAMTTLKVRIVVPVSDFTLTPLTLELDEYQNSANHIGTVTISNILPQNATDKGIEWSNSLSDGTKNIYNGEGVTIAGYEVGQDGAVTVTALRAGDMGFLTATATLSDGGNNNKVIKSCQISVKAFVPVNSMSLLERTYINVMDSDPTRTLNVKILPLEATVKTLSFTNSKMEGDISGSGDIYSGTGIKIASYQGTVDINTGEGTIIITALAVGMGTLTAKSGAISSNLEVNILDQAVVLLTGISVDKETLTLDASNTSLIHRVTVTVSIEPDNATDKKIKVENSLKSSVFAVYDTEVRSRTIATYGLTTRGNSLTIEFVGVRAGTGIITVTNGAGMSKEIEIFVN